MLKRLLRNGVLRRDQLRIPDVYLRKPGFHNNASMLDSDERPEGSGVGKKGKTFTFFEKAFLVVKQYYI